MVLRAVTRQVLRAPLVVHRLGRGELLSSRIVLLEHTGRRSGRRHRTAVEVVDRPTSDELVVVAGLGRRADWVRNVLAGPSVRILEGRRPARAARADVLDVDAARAWLDDLRAARPLSWAVISAILWLMVAGLLGPTTSPAPEPAVVRFVLDAEEATDRA